MAAPVLAHLDFSRPFILDTDGSNTHIGAVLSQMDLKEEEHPIGFFSCKLSPAELNYSVTEHECLAMVDGSNFFEPYLIDHEFLLHVDHQPLLWLLNIDNLKGQLACWIYQLSKFWYKIVHRPGIQHINTDTMTRPPHCNVPRKGNR